MGVLEWPLASYCFLSADMPTCLLSVRRTHVVRAAKELHFNKNMEALKKMQAGADKLATVVGVTLGPKVRCHYCCSMLQWSESAVGPADSGSAWQGPKPTYAGAGMLLLFMSCIYGPSACFVCRVLT